VEKLEIGGFQLLQIQNTEGFEIERKSGGISLEKDLGIKALGLRMHFIR
jgi:hypothetical protein